jgi:hypothetical protein
LAEFLEVAYLCLVVVDTVGYFLEAFFEKLAEEGVFLESAEVLVLTVLVFVSLVFSFLEEVLINLAGGLRAQLRFHLPD